MLKAIFLKEYWKMRRPWLALCIVNVICMAYIFINTRQLFTIDKAEMVWYQVLHLSQLPSTPFKYIPAFVGMIISCVQYFPEMRDGRLRLALHLPISPHRLILAHLFVGLVALSGLLIPDLIVLFFISNLYFPVEIGIITLQTATPWVCAGFAAYIGGALVLLEPGLKLRIVNVGITAGVTGLFLFPSAPGGYNHILPVLLFPLLLMIPSVLLPAYHFRFRRVSE